jgi:predicted membrane-bound dolichyl-phosphate-mannose-protein mannosyltransferase
MSKSLIKAVLSFLRTLIVILILTSLALILFSIPLGINILVGGDLEMRSPMHLYFLLIETIYFSCFILAWKLGESFRRSLRRFLHELGDLPSGNFLLVMPVITSVTHTALSFIESIQEHLQISTGFPPLSQDPFLAYFELAWSPIVEEVFFRALPLGFFYALYLSRYTGDFSVHRRLGISLLSFLSPEYAKRLLRTSGSTMPPRKIELDEWLIIISSSILFAFSHYLAPGTWGVGKLSLAFIQGLVMALSYILYGIHASILVHWYFNYCSYTYRLAEVLKPSLSFLSTLGKVVSMTLTISTLMLLILLKTKSMGRQVLPVLRRKSQKFFKVLTSRASIDLMKKPLNLKISRKMIPEVVLLAIVILALSLRLVILEYPKREASGGEDGCDFIFDEKYYVSAARDMLEGKATNNEHPPLVKVFIALSIVFLGDNPAGWRIFTISASSASIFLVYALSLLLNNRKEIALCSATLFAFDIMAFNIGQIAILDAPAITFTLAASILILRKRYDLSGFFLGLALLCKLTSVFLYLGIAVFLILSERARAKSFRKIVESCLRICVAALVVFLAGLWVYDSCYSAFAKNPLGHISYMLTYHSSLKYQDPKEVVLPLQWINPLSPFAPMPFYVITTREVVGGILKVYHPVAYYGIYSPLWWSIWLVVPLSLFYIFGEVGRRSFERTRLFALTWILASFLPYVFLAYLMSRWVYPFYFYSTLPGLYIGLSGCLNQGKHHRLLQAFLVITQAFWFVLWFPVKPKLLVDVFTYLGLPI